MRWIKRALACLLLVAIFLGALPVRSYAAKPDRYPVIFLPGIAGTELYNEQELVWVNTWRLLGSHLPVFNLLQMQWLLPIRLKPDGISPYYGHVIRTGDIMRYGRTDIYGGMIGALRGHGYVEGVDLQVFPYDWRQDLTRSADELGRVVDRVLARTGASQVVLVGHSMGGLIARDYVVRGGAPKVKATISLATPWLGSPMAYRAVEYGWDMGLKLPGTRWSALAPQDVKLLTRNYPSVYQLAPSRHYAELYPDGYLTRGGRNLTPAEASRQGLAPHNQGLAERAPAYRERLLDGRDHGVLQFVMAGKGHRTVSGFMERTDWLGVRHKTERYADGDEVVPLYSADLGYSRSPQMAERSIGQLQEVVYVQEGHTLFTGAPAVQQQVMQWLQKIAE